MGNIFAAGYRDTPWTHFKTYSTDLTGKTALVTGCTSGIGVVTARALASVGATVWIMGRNEKKLIEVRDQINKQVREERVHSIVCDLASLSSVRAAAAQFLSQSQSLHLLILNAGVMAIPYSKSANGADMQFATNHIAHQLLFDLLTPVLLKSTPARVVSVSSNGYFLTTPGNSSPLMYIDYSRLPAVDEKSYNPWGAYQQSKLANVLLAIEITHRYKDKGITAYSLNPGAIQTSLQDGAKFPGKTVLMFLTSPLWKSVDQGAATTIHCAVAPDIEQYSGEWFQDSHVTQQVAKSKFAEDEPSKLWQWTEEFIKQHQE